MIRNEVSLPKPVILGKIGSCYGFYGWLKMFSFTVKSENIFNYQPWIIKKHEYLEVLELENWRYSNRNIIVKFKNIDNCNLANSLINCLIVVDSSRLPKLENIFYWTDLIGCQVISTKGYKLGKVINMIETGSNDVLVIKAHVNDKFKIKERLIPFLNGRVIKKVEIITKLIEVDWNPCF